jgi:LacI family transcriptional regulator
MPEPDADEGRAAGDASSRRRRRTAREIPPPTVRTVAAQVGVSPMTVSRALRNDPTVLPETRERVLAAAQQLGYRRNELARSLRIGGTSGMVGLVVTNLAHPFCAQLALGVETISAKHGMKVVVSNTGDDVDRERELVNDLAGRRVDGIIVVPAGHDQRHLDPARLGGVPVVLAARPPLGIDLDSVLLDDFGGAREVTSLQVRDGHRRIGFLGPPAAWTSAERLRGFRAAHAEAGLPLDDTLVRGDQREVAAAEAAIRELLSLQDPPTAFFCANSRNTIGAYRVLHAGRLQHALSGFDDFELADMLDLPVRLLAYDTGAMGRLAAELLADRIEAGSSRSIAARRIVLPTTVLEYGIRP